MEIENIIEALFYLNAYVSIIDIDGMSFKEEGYSMGMIDLGNDLSVVGQYSVEGNSEVFNTILFRDDQMIYTGKIERANDNLSSKGLLDNKISSANLLKKIYIKAPIIDDSDKDLVALTNLLSKDEIDNIMAMTNNTYGNYYNFVNNINANTRYCKSFK